MYVYVYIYIYIWIQGVCRCIYIPNGVRFSAYIYADARLLVCKRVYLTHTHAYCCDLCLRLVMWPCGWCVHMCEHNHAPRHWMDCYPTLPHSTSPWGQSFRERPYRRTYRAPASTKQTFMSFAATSGRVELNLVRLFRVKFSRVEASSSLKIGDFMLMLELLTGSGLAA